MSFENPEDEFKKMQEDAQERAEANVDPETDKEIAELSKEHEKAETFAEMQERTQKIGPQIDGEDKEAA